jgi:hypothetical protein
VQINQAINHDSGFCFQFFVLSKETFSKGGYMTDEFDNAAIAWLNQEQLLRLRTQTRNEITLLRSEQNNGGSDRGEKIAFQQSMLRAINARLEPAK